MSSVQFSKFVCRSIFISSEGKDWVRGEEGTSSIMFFSVFPIEYCPTFSIYHQTSKKNLVWKHLIDDVALFGVSLNAINLIPSLFAFEGVLQILFIHIKPVPSGFLMLLRPFHVFYFFILSELPSQYFYNLRMWNLILVSYHLRKLV